MAKQGASASTLWITVELLEALTLFLLEADFVLDHLHAFDKPAIEGHRSGNMPSACSTGSQVRRR